MMVDEIDIKKPVLEQMVMSANNFVENCAPEEGLIIKQKLDNLHARYNQVGMITSMQIICKWDVIIMQMTA